MNKGYIVRLYPNQKQKEQLEKSADAVRFIYNEMIEINQKRYNRGGKWLSAYDMHKYLTKIKKQYRFLNEVSNQSLQISCSDLAKAYVNFFKKRSSFPKFKKKNGTSSFTSMNDPRTNICRIKEDKIKLPKIEFIKYRGNLPLEGKLKRITVKKIAKKYYASILIDDGKSQPEPRDFDKLTGIDMGLKDFAVLSNGSKVPSQKVFQKAQRKLRQKQKALSRRLKGSKKREQKRLEVARLHQKVSNQRKDFHHKLTKSLVANDKNQAFAIEDLNVRGLIKNRRLAKSISDAGWNQFKLFLKYKSADVGKQVFEVARFYASSKTCSSCGVVNGDLKLADRNWICGSCKVDHDRDFNASLNIALEAARNVAGGDVIRLEVLQNNILSSVVEADNISNNNSENNNWYFFNRPKN